MSCRTPFRHRPRGRVRPLLTVLSWGVMAAVGAGGAGGQEELTLPELEDLYRGALAGYQEAFKVLEVYESQFDRASQDLNNAIAENDESARNRAYQETQRIAGLRRQAQRRVEEKAAELRQVRRRLLDANAAYLEDLLAQASAAPDSVTQRSLAAFIADTRNRITELRSLEDPQITLDPEPDINAEPRDGPAALRAKASILELRATQYEEQFAFNEVLLEGLRRDQNLLRRSGDFLADFARFDDPTLPVGAPGVRPVTPPGEANRPPGADSTATEGGFLTLDQRIDALETLQQEITQRIQNVRVRAQTLRRLAGGEWA